MLSQAADDADLPADPEFRAAIMGYAEWGTRAAEEFASGDPFVLNGVVRRWHIREWDEILGGP